MASKTKTTTSPIQPAQWEPADAGALQALVRGEAEPHQQKRALDWIIKQAAGTYDLSYRPNSHDETQFAEGKRFVGLQIVKLLNLNLGVFKKEK